MQIYSESELINIGTPRAVTREISVTTIVVYQTEKLAAAGAYGRISQDGRKLAHVGAQRSSSAAPACRLRSRPWLMPRRCAGLPSSKTCFARRDDRGFANIERRIERGLSATPVRSRQDHNEMGNRPTDGTAQRRAAVLDWATKPPLEGRCEQGSSGGVRMRGNVGAIRFWLSAKPIIKCLLWLGPPRIAPWGRRGSAGS
jgi:hypothetical protein